MRLGSAGEPLRWYISHPPKSGPATSQLVRLASAVRMKAPFRVPTRTRTPVIVCPPGRPYPWSRYAAFVGDPRATSIPTSQPGRTHRGTLREFGDMSDGTPRLGADSLS